MFPDQLIIRDLSEAELRAKGWSNQHYEVFASFGYANGSGQILVPKGFFTDFASVPDSVKLIIDDDSPFILFPSVVHDFLYDQSGVLPDRAYTRAEADQFLRDAMMEVGATKAQADIVYEAVHLFGSGHWGQGPK